MAVIQLSGIGITDARNKLGDTVFTRNRGGQTTRQYVIPANTITDPRTATRDLFATACSLWAAISPEAFIQWQIFAKRFTKRNALAQKYNPTARNIFIECNMNLMSASALPIEYPLFNAMPLAIKSCSVVTLNPTDIFLLPTFTDNTSVVPADCILIVSASPCVSSGINYPRNNQLRIRTIGSGTDITSFNFWNNYDATFGSPVTGDKVFFRVRLVHEFSGVGCVPLMCSAIVS